MGCVLEDAGSDGAGAAVVVVSAAVLGALPPPGGVGGGGRLVLVILALLSDLLLLVSVSVLLSVLAFGVGAGGSAFGGLRGLSSSLLERSSSDRLGGLGGDIGFGGGCL